MLHLGSHTVPLVCVDAISAVWSSKTDFTRSYRRGFALGCRSLLVLFLPAGFLCLNPCLGVGVHTGSGLFADLIWRGRILQQREKYLNYLVRAWKSQSVKVTGMTLVEYSVPGDAAYVNGAVEKNRDNTSKRNEGLHVRFAPVTCLFRAPCLRSLQCANWSDRGELVLLAQSQTRLISRPDCSFSALNIYLFIYLFFGWLAPRVKEAASDMGDFFAAEHQVKFYATGEQFKLLCIVILLCTQSRWSASG